VPGSGWVRLGHVALDGTKVAANASAHKAVKKSPDRQTVLSSSASSVVMADMAPFHRLVERATR